MLAVALWIIAAYTALSVVVTVASDREKKPWMTAFTLLYGATVVVVLVLAALSIRGA